MNNYETIKKINQLIKQSPTKERWLTIKDVQHISSLSYSTIRREIGRGYLKKSKRSGKLLFHPDCVKKWLGS